MRSTEKIATLALTSLVMVVLTAGMMRVPASDRLRSSTMPIGRYALLKSIGRLDTPRRTRTYSLITNC